MNTDTITATSAAAVSRKLSALGFEKLGSRAERIGFDVWKDGGILVVTYTYGKSTAAEELAAAGYLVNVQSVSVCQITGRHQEIFEVLGKVGR